MTLAAFQAALGHLVRAGEGGRWDAPALSPAERALLREVAGSPGLRLTAAIQRSWCEGRASRAARLTLSVLPSAARRDLVAAWVAAGGGTSSFYSVEAEQFCDFIAARLPDPSHALTVCRLEQATIRAATAAETFHPPEADPTADPGCAVVAGRGAGLVAFFAEPSAVLGALRTGAPLPACGAVRTWLLFAPGLAGLARTASDAEAALWHHLAAARLPVRCADLRSAGFGDALLRTFLCIGASEVARRERPATMPRRIRKTAETAA